jgi:hypothetical protein
MHCTATSSGRSVAASRSTFDDVAVAVDDEPHGDLAFEIGITPQAGFVASAKSTE